MLLFGAVLRDISVLVVWGGGIRSTRGEAYAGEAAKVMGDAATLVRIRPARPPSRYKLEDSIVPCKFALRKSAIGQVREYESECL